MSLAFAVTVTWSVFATIFVLAGMWTTLFFPGLGHLARIRISLWLGLTQVTVLLIAINFFAPLGSMTPLAWIVALASLSVAVWLLRRGWQRGRTAVSTTGSETRRPTTWQATLWTLIPITALMLFVILSAHSFAGPLGNWDAGLYHLNAIQYAAEYPTIPGLANFHSRLGTNSASTLISAMLAATPWGIEAFRLLVGLFVFLFVIDLIIRLLDVRRTSISPGTLIMLLAATGFIPSLMVSPEVLITSPTPDTISMILVVVTVAYLIDAFWMRHSTWSVMAAIVAVLAATMRTQLWVFTVLIILVLIAHALRSHHRSRDWRNNRVFIAIGAVLTALSIVGMMIRDYFLSGWLLFPATLFPMPVDWRVLDPAGSREWILSWAREPGGSPEIVLNSWSWLWPWVTRSASDWAIQLAAGMLLASLLIWLFIKFNPSSGKGINTTSPSPIGVKGLLLLMIPVLGSMSVWFFTAPDPRFAWGSIAALGLIPLTLAIARLARVFTVPRNSVAVTVLVASLMTLVIAGPAISNILQVRGFVTEGFELRTYSFGPINIRANITPVESATIVEFQLNDGNIIMTPTQDDRCHLSFPTCSPYPDPTMQFRGDSIADGFRDGTLIFE